MLLTAKLTTMATNFLPLELGKTYTTRAGDVVKIINVDYSYSMPFFGNILDKEEKRVVRPASFNAAGMYKNEAQTQFDITGLVENK
jgi:hypothetical protein